MFRVDEIVGIYPNSDADIVPVGQGVLTADGAHYVVEYIRWRTPDITRQRLRFDPFSRTEVSQGRTCCGRSGTPGMRICWPNCFRRSARRISMDDAHEERFRQHEALMARLAFLLDAQHETNQELKGFNECRSRSTRT